MSPRVEALAGYAMAVYADLKARGEVRSVEEALRRVPACVLEDMREVAVEFGRGFAQAAMGRAERVAGDAVGRLFQEFAGFLDGLGRGPAPRR